MAVYTNDLRLKEIATGDEANTWGVSTNTNLGLIADALGLGTKQLAADADETFTIPDGITDGARALYLKLTSAVTLTATRTVTLGPTTVSKVWIIENATTGSQIITIKQGSGATVNVPSGSKLIVVTDGAGAGAAVFNANPTETGGTVTSVEVSGGTTGLTYTGGPITVSGTITMAGTLAVANGGTGVTTSTGTGAAVLSTSPTLVTPVLGTPTSGTLTNATGLPLTSGVTGTLPLANGGTAATTATGARASILPSYAGSAGYALVVNGGATDVVWAVTPGVGSVTSVDVSGGTTGLTFSGGPITAAGTITASGTLAVANGGTGLTAPGTSGNVLTSNGTAWVSSPAASFTYVRTEFVATASQTTFTVGYTVGYVQVWLNGVLLLGEGVDYTASNGTSIVFTVGATLDDTVTVIAYETFSVADALTASDLGAGVLTWLGNPSSANLATAITDETGSGALVFATSPTLVTPILGTPTSATLTNATGLPPAGVVGTAAILGANTFTGTQNLADNILQRANLLDYGEVTNAIGSTGGGTQDIDLTLGNVVTLTVDTSANTFTFSNPTASDEGCGFTLYITNGGSQTVNWPASVDWPSGTAPTLTASGVDKIVFETVDGGVIWYGNICGQAYA